jgi:ubiquinone/menaquinone biosynthesis C-methylase UbiE
MRDYMNRSKWPKIFPPLTLDQENINHDFVKHWHEILSKKTRYNLIEQFNHGYVVKNMPKDFLTTLEIGAGLGEHLAYEKLSKEQEKNYVSLELRENMASEIRTRFPKIRTETGDCQTTLPFNDNSFDRILAIHVLEHLPNLPAAVKEMHRLCHKEQGYFSIVIPCEGGLTYTIARRLSAQRIFEKRYKQSYQWFIEREHVNTPNEILEELAPFFEIQHRQFFPFHIPLVSLNLCIGLTLRPRKKCLK